MDNNELKEMISDYVLGDEEVLDSIIILEGNEFADGAIGITNDYHVVYSYERLVDSLAKTYGTEEDAIDWLDYNTMRSLPYMASMGNEPIIIHEFER